MSLGLVGNENLLTQASSQTAFAANCISTPPSFAKTAV